MNLRSARLAVLGAIVPSFFASVAQAESPAESGPQAPMAAPAMTAAEIDTASVVAPTSGATFSVVLGSRIRAYHQPIEEGGQPGSPGLSVLGEGGGTRIFATRGAGDEVYAAYGARTYRFQAGAKPVVSELGDRFVVGLGQAGATAPWLAVADGKGLEIRAFESAGAPGISVRTPQISQALELSGFYATDTFGMFAYPSGEKTTVLLLDDKGATAVPISLETSGDTKVSLTPIGADVILTRWTATGTNATRLSSEGVSLETKDLPAGALAVVADPKAPGGADAWVIASNGGSTFTATPWRTATPELPDAQKSITLGTSVRGRFLDGACSANGCLFVFSNEQQFQYTTIWAPRNGAPKATQVATPNETPAGTGGGRPSYPGNTMPRTLRVDEAPAGCSAASTPTGGGLGASVLVGLGVLVATLRRRRHHGDRARQ